MVICLQQGANDLHIIQLMPLPPVISCFIKIQIGLTFLVLPYSGCPGKKSLNGFYPYFYNTVNSHNFSGARHHKSPDAVTDCS